MRSRWKMSIGWVIFNTIMVFATYGLWMIPVFIYWFIFKYGEEDENDGSTNGNKKVESDT